jgi:hypothetical protein
MTPGRLDTAGSPTPLDAIVVLDDARLPRSCVDSGDTVVMLLSALFSTQLPLDGRSRLMAPILAWARVGIGMQTADGRRQTADYPSDGMPGGVSR